MGVGRTDFSDAANWQTPRELPDLRRVGIVALDTEENDEGLRADRGSGWPWRGGHVAGISVAWRADGEMHAIYIPLRHPDTDNFDPDRVYRWLKDLVASDVRIVTHNGIYDFGWLRAEGGVVMPPSDRLEETGALATMIDENQFSYSLDSLCGRYGLPGKDEALLNQAVEAAGCPVKRAKEYIWQLPARFVGPYAEIDAVRRSSCLKRSIRYWIAKEHATPIGSKLICCRWCSKCAAAAFALIRTPPSRRAICCWRNATPRSQRFRNSMARRSAWTRSTVASGRKRPSSITA